MSPGPEMLDEALFVRHSSAGTFVIPSCWVDHAADVNAVIEACANEIISSKEPDPCAAAPRK